VDGEERDIPPGTAAPATADPAPAEQGEAGDGVAGEPRVRVRPRQQQVHRRQAQGGRQGRVQDGGHTQRPPLFIASVNGSDATLSRPRCVRTGSVPCATVWSKTLSNFSLSYIISSRLRPVRSNSVVSSMASHGPASSHMPQ